MVIARTDFSTIITVLFIFFTAMLDNPCLMNEHRCSPLGTKFTCKSDSSGYYCQDVCVDSHYCGGGECHAEHDPNNGYAGWRKCR